MKQVLVKQGQVVTEEIPSPQVEPGCVLVQVAYSCISIGTEMSGVKESNIPLWKRALKNPTKVKKVIQLVKSEGLSRTKDVVQGKLTEGTPTGYSASGIVTQVGEGIQDLKVGDLVACAGAQYANHCEVICVPRNLVTPIPERLNLAQASTVTLGAIAIQGVRRANPSLGETFTVIGLGILGQITVQILKANGCKVIGTDLDPERIKIALALGMDEAINPVNHDDFQKAFRLTNGYGVDGAIITAASPSHEIVSNAFQICRKKGRVVLVGDVGLNLNREDIYKKELDFYISTSYGPGRYDHRYEEEGQDYPLSYVRWTENRNMEEYLHLLESGKVNIEKLISKIYLIDQAPEAYEALKKDQQKPLMVLLSYPERAQKEKFQKTILNPLAKPSTGKQINIALAGAGNFAKAMHLPNLKSLPDLFHLEAVMSKSGYNAANTAKQYGAQYSTTDFNQIIQDPKVSAVLICTRHHLHAEMVLASLKAEKHVLVEKPLALNRQDLEKIINFYKQFSANDLSPILLTGFNRRFSPFAREIKSIVSRRTNPMIINYRMNSGYIPLDHWVHSAEGGGRNIGEACHIYDLFTYFTDSPFLKIEAQSIIRKTAYYTNQDNFVATITFADGSLANLTYTALGSQNYPKEMMEIFVDGEVIQMMDYKILTSSKHKSPLLELKLSDKGQKLELETFGKAVKNGGNWPIELWQQIQAMEIAFKVDSLLA